MATHEWETGQGGAMISQEGDLLTVALPLEIPNRMRDGVLGAEILRLASPETAWETMEALWLGSRRLEWEQFAEFYQETPKTAHPSDIYAVFRQNPIGFFMHAGEAGKSLFAECLRLGRESK